MFLLDRIMSAFIASDSATPLFVSFAKQQIPLLKRELVKVFFATPNSLTTSFSSFFSGSDFAKDESDRDQSNDQLIVALRSFEEVFMSYVHAVLVDGEQRKMAG